jgi:hypothetical protein
MIGLNYTLNTISFSARANHDGTHFKLTNQAAKNCIREG